jgi:tetratricopeptide (TPR) repeat protein
MITEAPRDSPTIFTADQTDRLDPPSDQHYRRRLPWLRLLVMLSSVALISFNIWWYWYDSRPVPDIMTIEALLSREQYVQAEAALHERLRRSRQDGEARSLLARTLAAQGDMQGCIVQLREIPYWWPAKAEALFHEGQACLMTDRAKDAETCWLAVIKDDPLHPSPPDIIQTASRQLLGLYATENRWDAAAAIIWEAYDRANPADQLSLLGMRVKSELERLAPETTIGQIKRYVAADPTDWEALRALARAELALGREEDANRDFQACLAGRPDDPRVWRDYLGMLYDLGDQDAWTTLLVKVPPSAESESEIWRFRGLLKEKTGDWAGAAQDYHIALNHNPYLMASHYRLAMVEERLGHNDVALEHRKKADQLREAKSELRVAFGELITAEEASENQKASNPDLPASMRRLASVCEILGWARLAEAWYKLADSS